MAQAAQGEKKKVQSADAWVDSVLKESRPTSASAAIESGTQGKVRSLQKQFVTEIALPTFGAIVGSAVAPGLAPQLAAGPALALRSLLSGIGAAGGELSGEGVKAATGEDVNFGEALKRAGASGATQMGLEAATGGLSLGITKGIGLMRRFSRHAGRDLLATEISSDAMSPGQVGRFFREAFGEEMKLAKGELRAAKESLKTAFASQPAFSLKPDQTLAVIDDEISTISRKIGEGAISEAETSNLSKIRDSLSKLKSRLQNQLNPPTQFKTDGTALREVIRPKPAGADEVAQTLLDMRTDAFQQIREFDPSQAQRIAKRLAKATHGDIMGNLQKAGLSKEAAAFSKASGRYRELADIADRLSARVDTGAGEVMAKIIGDKRVTPETVVRLLAVNPETAIDAIRIIKKGKAEPLNRIRRAIFEDLVTHGKLEPALDSSLREVFGADAKKVGEFARLLEESGKRSGTLNTVLGWFSVGAGPARIGLHNPSGNVVLLSPRKLAKVLDKPEAMKQILTAIQQPVDNKGQAVSRIGLNAARFLYAAVQVPEPAIEEGKKSLTRPQ